MWVTLKDKFKESLSAVLPIALIVLCLSVVLTPLDTGTFLLFAIGVLLLVAGTSLFTLGAEVSMLTIGQKVGSVLSKNGKVWLVAFVGFLIGVIVTVAEPDLSIFAGQVEGIDSTLLIVTVSVGVGIFLCVALLRILCKIKLSLILGVLYPVAFLLALGFVPNEFWALSFDAGGVTTGPVTVPFIMALGVGVASVRSGKASEDDSFGLVALSSLGPVLSVLILGIVFRIDGGSGTTAASVIAPETTRSAFLEYGKSVGKYAVEVVKALSPILAFFLLFQLVTKSFHKGQMIRVLIGILYTFTGLTLFLTGANIGFTPIGTTLGKMLAEKSGGWMLVPVGMLLGYFVVSAEPAVYVLNRQVEQVSAGAVSAKAMKRGLCAGVCLAIGLAMLRILLGFNIMWILIPGYLIALILMFFTPAMFTGIAYDSGGVASGAMVSSFVLPMAIGACAEIAETEIMTLAFGCVALVALAPLVSIQILGVLYKRKTATYKKNFLEEDDDVVEYKVD